MLGKIKEIKEVCNVEVGNKPALNGKNGSKLGMSAMINCFLCGGGNYDGYEVITDKHRFLILIDNGQSCCESWGYLTTNDDLQAFLGKSIKEVVLTDTALNNKKVEEQHPYGFDEGGIQFVTFYMECGDKLQLAVYNGHNGYYGHGIYVVKDDEILLQDTL